MAWWSGLGPEVIRELRDRYPALSLEQIGIEAMQRSEYADEFARTDARVFTDRDELHMGVLHSPDDFPLLDVPAGNAADFRDLVVAVMLAGSGEEPSSTGAAGKKPGRRKGSEVPIPDDTVLEVLRLVVEEAASARLIAAATDDDSELEFVNRIKAGVIVKWVEKHPAKARRAVARQEIPWDFPATDGGRLLPEL